MSASKSKKTSPLNRTIFLTDSELKEFSRKLSSLNKKTGLSSIANKIINQDLFEAVEFFPDKFVDLLFIDPPYNLDKKFHQSQFQEMTETEYEVWMDSWLSKLIRTLKPGASVYICSDWKTSISVYNVASKYFKLRNRITWEREKGRGAKKNWKNCTEDIWFFTVSDDYTFNLNDVKLRRKVLAPYKDLNGLPKDWKIEGNKNFRDTYPSNIWTDISVPFWSMPENTTHPTQKPEKLLAKIILASSNEGDLVFDPFSGSGTTAVVAKKLGRKFCAVESERIYCCLTAKRLKIADKNKSIQGYVDNVFWERNTLLTQQQFVNNTKINKDKSR